MHLGFTGILQPVLQWTLGQFIFVLTVFGRTTNVLFQKCDVRMMMTTTAMMITIPTRGFGCRRYRDRCSTTTLHVDIDCRRPAKTHTWAELDWQTTRNTPANIPASIPNFEQVRGHCKRYIIPLSFTKETRCTCGTA